MCDRFVVRDQEAVERAFEIVPSLWAFQAHYNITPTDRLTPNVPVVRAVDGERTGVMMRWPLIPEWCRGVAPKFATFNARAECLASKRLDSTWRIWPPIWRKGNRCIIPAAGFYASQWNGVQGYASRTELFYVQAADQDIFGFAGLWEKSTPEGSEPIYGCSIVTTAANDFIARIHNSRKRGNVRVMLPRGERHMPVILRRDDWESWLTGTIEEARASIRQYPDKLMAAHPVSSRAYNAKNNDPSLIDPIGLTIDPLSREIPPIQ